MRALLGRFAKEADYFIADGISLFLWERGQG
jgi:hypothetical protein